MSNFNHADCAHAATKLARRDCRLGRTKVTVTIPGHGLFETDALNLRAARATFRGEGIATLQDRIEELVSIDYTDVDDRLSLTVVLAELMFSPSRDDAGNRLWV